MPRNLQTPTLQNKTSPGQILSIWAKMGWVLVIANPVQILPHHWPPSAIPCRMVLAVYCVDRNVLKLYFVVT